MTIALKSITAPSTTIDKDRFKDLEGIFTRIKTAGHDVMTPPGPFCRTCVAIIIAWRDPLMSYM